MTQQQENEQLAKAVVEAVGGPKNIERLTHCVSRLRFILRDVSIPDTQAIKQIDGVLGVVEQGGQYQVIVGNRVEKVYNAAVTLLPAGQLADPSGNPNGAKAEGSLLDRFLKTVSTIFTPILAVFTACGILKGLVSLAVALNVLSTDSGTYTVLFAISNSIFYFLPVILGATAAERFGISRTLGIVIGASLIYPTVIAAASSDSFTFLGIPMDVQDYSSTVFPVILTVYFASLLYRNLAKVVPDIVGSFLNPMITLVVSIPLALFIVGPVTMFVSGIILQIVEFIYNLSPVLCALALGGPWMILVLFGLHWAFIPLLIEQIATVGYSTIGGLLCANMWAFMAAMLAVALRAKGNPKLRALGFSTSLTCFLGVSEPGIFGVLLPYKRPLITAVIASSLGSIPAALMGTKGYAIGASGIFGLTGNIAPTGLDSGFYGAVISAILAFVIGLAITYTFGTKNTDIEVPAQ